LTLSDVTSRGYSRGRATGRGGLQRSTKRRPLTLLSRKVAEGLKLWPALREELLNFRRKINLKTAHDSYEHWRDSDHDDLVLAVALACWWIRRRRSRLRMMRKPLGW